MFVLIGYAVALGCIFGGFILHGGNIAVVLHALPVETIVIGGGAFGAFVVTNQPKVLKATFGAMPKLLKGSKYTKARYMELMALLYDILQKARKGTSRPRPNRRCSRSTRRWAPTITWWSSSPTTCA